MAAPTDALVFDIAEKLGRDHRTVIRVIAGLPVRGRASEAIRRELRARGVQQAVWAANNNASPPPSSAA